MTYFFLKYADNEFNLIIWIIFLRRDIKLLMMYQHLTFLIMLKKYEASPLISINITKHNYVNKY